jgi:hypothetical protein
MDSGLPPLVWELRILVEPLAICGKSDFFQGISEHGIFHGIINWQENKSLKIRYKKGLFTIEWE